MKALASSALVAALFALGGCAPRPVVGNDGHASTVPAATPTGPAVSCVQLGQIRESRVRDDWTIDFRTGGNTWYRNTLPNRCNGLGFERTFSYSTAIPLLCNVDIITVFATNGPVGPRGSCGLGMFQPVTLAK
jgi:hypothetical protein